MAKRPIAAAAPEWLRSTGLTRLSVNGTIYRGKIANVFWLADDEYAFDVVSEKGKKLIGKVNTKKDAILVVHDGGA